MKKSQSRCWEKKRNYKNMKKWKMDLNLFENEL